jgi:hypothetical protein
MNPPRMTVKRLSNGMTGMVRTNALGALCAYVALPKEHPFYGLGYDAIPSAPVHGGLTFAGPIEEFANWAAGCDFAHAGDYVPAILPSGKLHTMSDAFAELETLAKWLENQTNLRIN